MSGSHTGRGGEEARDKREQADEAAIEAETRKAELRRRKKRRGPRGGFRRERHSGGRRWRRMRVEYMGH